MRRVLVGIDGSPESRKAVELAARIARDTRSGLEVAHVLHDIAYGAPGMAFTVHDEQKQRTDRAHLMLAETADGVPPGLAAVDTSLLEGSPAFRLAKEAQREDIWLVVIGHRGRGSVQRVLLGSTADRLVQISPKPVIVVR